MLRMFDGTDFHIAKTLARVAAGEGTPRTFGKRSSFYEGISAGAIPRCGRDQFLASLQTGDPGIFTGSLSSNGRSGVESERRSVFGLSIEVLLERIDD